MYKKPAPIFLLFILFSLACGKRENAPLLNELLSTQSMGDTCATAAIARFDSLAPLFEEESEYMRNKYALLGVRLRDKAYITHTSDSLICELYSYFMKNGTTIDKQEVCYYMGRVYRDMRDSPRAVRYLLEAVSIAENNTDIDSAIWESSCLQLTSLYRKQINYQESLKMSLKALEIAKKRNKRTVIVNYASVSNCYYYLDDSINAIKYNRITIGEILKTGTLREYAKVLASCLLDLTAFGCKAEADYCYSFLQSIPEDSLPNNYLIACADYLAKFVSPDSAAPLYHRLYETTEYVADRYNASRDLMIYYAAKGEYELATEYALLFNRANNEWRSEMNIEHTRNSMNEFQYHRNREEDAAILLQASQTRFWWVVSVLLFIVVLLFISLLFYRRHSLMLKIITAKNGAIKSAREHIKQYEKELTESNEIIVTKEKELENNKQRIIVLNEELEEADDTIKKLLMQNESLTKLTLMKNFESGVANAPEIIAKYKKAATGKISLSDDDWSELLAAVDTLYPGFTKEIQERLKDVKLPILRICYLLKIGMTNPQIVNITGYPSQTVWYRVRRIEEAFGGTLR